ncbi:hypothetical protein [Actinoplanes sp. NPDC051859]|uniref:hypothetical protein n=1 Tax=Actinoplanes sp. NPDC051859 TaxID=3363909 RepID=UPI0037BDF969
MTKPSVSRQWPQAVLAVLTAVWLWAVLRSVLLWAFAGTDGIFGNQANGNAAVEAALQQEKASATMVLFSVMVGGPVLIAVVAFACRMSRTAATYLVLALASSILAAVLGAQANRMSPSSPTPPPAPVRCQEHSGGEAECPGG